jgi:glutamyl-tRNA(Gln) amidotransferase subunit D
MLKDDEIQGIIITHGTDFLHYTSAALSFFFPKLNKPIALTYSQRSSDRASSDARLNLICATRAAISDAGEVMLVGHASENDDFCFAHRGVKVRKLHTSRRDAFQSVNSKPIAKIWPDKLEFISKYKKKSDNYESDINFSEKVALLKFYPGQSPEILDFLAQKNKGIIIEAGALGHVLCEGNNNWLPTIRKLIKQETIICIASQAISGRVDMLVYGNGRMLLDTGVISCEDMHAETAFVKLGWILGHKSWRDKARERMKENFVGEFSERLTAE